jgi:hypothetical protein
MLGRAQNGATLTITKITVGSGAAAQPSDLWPLTALIAHEMDVTISAKRDYGQGTLLVEGSFTSQQAPHAFLMKEVGILAHIGTEADRLYSVANCFTDAPIPVDPAAPTVQTFKIKLIVDRIPTANLVVQIGPSENVIGSNIGPDTVGAGVYKDAAGNVLNFKRLVAGYHVEIIEDPSEDFLTIGVKVVPRDLDFYVPQTYPGISDPNVLFPTIEAALASVADLVIPTNRKVTVHVWSGNFNQSAPIVIDHPNAGQIQIIGHDLISRAVTGNVTVAGTLPNMSVTLNMADTSGIAVNDVIYLWNAPHALLESCGYVTSIRAGQNIVVRMIMQAVAPPATIAALGNTKVVLFPSQYACTLSASTPMFDCRTGIGLIKNFGLRSTTAQVGNGVACYGNSTIENMAVVGFQVGYGSSNGNLNVNPVVAANGCQVGISAGPAGSIAIAPNSPDGWNRVSWTGCFTYGVWIVAGSYTGGGGTYSYICGNATGVRGDTQAFFGNSNAPATTGGIVVGFNGKGLVAVELGLIMTALNATNAVTGNVTLDCQAASGAQIAIVHNVNNSGHYSPANQVLGPDGGYISILTP